MEAFKLIADLGFSIAAVISGGFYIWKFVTTEILPTLGNAMTTLIALIDRIRMLDNDMIRLDQKINTIIELKKQEKIENERQSNE